MVLYLQSRMMYDYLYVTDACYHQLPYQCIYGTWYCTWYCMEY